MFEDLLETKKRVFGLDIGSTTLKVVELRKSGKYFRLVGCAEARIPLNSLQKNGIQNKKELAETIKTACASSKPHPITRRFVCSALPESLIFSKIINLPALKKNELEKAIPYEAAEYFPIPINEMNVDWHINENKNNPNIEAFVVAAPKNLVNDFIEVISGAGLELAVLETKPLAAFRAVSEPDTKGISVLVDIGAESSAITIIDNGLVAMTGTVKSGGNSITRELSTALKITLDEAEKIKKTEGLSSNTASIDKNKIMLNNIKPIIDEIDNSIKYYKTRVKKEAQIKEILLYGGAGRLIGLDTYIQKMLTIPTKLANPWSKIKLRPSEAINPNDSLKYTTAIGLAMREM